MDKSTLKKSREGKTKIIWEIPGTHEVLIESKDDITAGDGKKHDILEQKSTFSNLTTIHVFRLLEKHGVPTHFLRQEDIRTFRAHEVLMIPIELVARRIATGSYLKRHPTVQEGSVFGRLKMEFFFKDDSNHDPLMIWNPQTHFFDLYDAKKPRQEGRIGGIPWDIPYIPKDEKKIRALRKILSRVFTILQEAWADQQVVLVDLKIECGYTKDGELVVADVIDNDSWRIWPEGDKTKMKDKQVYRNLGLTTPEALNAIKENYAWVTEATAKFLNP